MRSLDIKQLRTDTIGCQHVLHFNNAGAALPPICVVNAIKSHIDLEATRGGYEAAEMAALKTDAFYEVAAQLIHCSREKIAFLDNATRAWEMAFCSLQLNRGDRVLTCVSEYASNYLSLLHTAKRTGIIIEVIDNDATGQLDTDALENAIDDRVKLIAITHVPTQGGLINPVEGVGKIANKFKIPYLLDATQSVGQMPIDVVAIGCDFLCATGRKYLRGPRGTGFLYARKELINQCNPPFIDLHSATWTENNTYLLRPNALRFETWEQNIAGKIGITEAIQYALKLGLPAIWDRISYLAKLLRQNLSNIPGVTLQDLGVHQCGIVTFICKNHPPESIQHYLAEQNINVSVSLKEYARLDMGKRNLSALTRASVHYYNTEEEIEIFCAAIKKIS